MSKFTKFVKNNKVAVILASIVVLSAILGPALYFGLKNRNNPSTTLPVITGANIITTTNPETTKPTPKPEPTKQVTNIIDIRERDFNLLGYGKIDINECFYGHLYLSYPISIHNLKKKENAPPNILEIIKFSSNDETTHLNYKDNWTGAEIIYNNKYFSFSELMNVSDRKMILNNPYKLEAASLYPHDKYYNDKYYNMGLIEIYIYATKNGDINFIYNVNNDNKNIYTFKGVVDNFYHNTNKTNIYSNFSNQPITSVYINTPPGITRGTEYTSKGEKGLFWNNEIEFTGATNDYPFIFTNLLNRVPKHILDMANK